MSKSQRTKLRFDVEIVTDDPDYDFRDVRNMLDNWFGSCPDQREYDWKVLTDPDE